MRFVEMFHPESGGIAMIPLAAALDHLDRGWLVNEAPPAREVPDASTEQPQKESS